MDFCILKLNNNPTDLTQNNTILHLQKILNSLGFKISQINYIDNNPGEIFENLNFFKEKNLIIIGLKDLHANFAIKELLNNFFKLNFEKNVNVENYLKQQDINPNTISIESYFPSDSYCLVGNKGSSGFIKQLNKILIFIPDVLDEFVDTFETDMKNYFLKNPQREFTSFTKLITSNSEELINYLAEQKGIDYSLIEKNIDKTVFIKSKANLTEFIANFYEKFSNSIYSDKNISIYEVNSNLLELSRFKISIFETLTNGKITQNLLQYLNSSNFSNSYICLNEKSLPKEFNLSQNIKNGEFISLEMCYELAAEMLKNTNADIVIVNLSRIFNDNLDELESFIAVGNYDGIHVYKSKYNGSYDENIENSTLNSMLYLYKKLKKDIIIDNQTI